jgi:hypothetical protein
MCVKIGTWIIRSIYTREIWGEAHLKMGCPCPTKKELVLVADVIVDLPMDGDEVVVEGAGRGAGATPAKKGRGRAGRAAKKTVRRATRTAVVLQLLQRKRRRSVVNLF